MRRALLLVLVIAPIARDSHSQELAVQPPKRGKVTPFAYTYTGRAIEQPRLEFYKEEDRELKMLAVDPSKVPYGKYRVRIEADGFRSEWRDVRVEQPEMQIRQDFHFLPMHGGLKFDRSDISGTLQMDGPFDDVWVKLVPLRGVGGGESAVGKLRTFLVAGWRIPRTSCS